MMTTQPKPSRLIGPEDVRPGDYVTVAHATYELIPSPCDERWRRDPGPVRITVMPCCAGRPLKVIDRCAPFVLVEDPDSTRYTLDLRRLRLARLSKRYGRSAFKQIRRDHQKQPGRGPRESDC